MLPALTPRRSFASHFPLYTALLVVVAMACAWMLARTVSAAPALSAAPAEAHARLHFDELAGTLVADASTPAPVETAIAGADSAPTPIVAPTSIDDAAQSLPAIVADVEQGKYLVALGMILGILVFAFERYLRTSIPSKYLQWAMIGAAILGGVGDALAHGNSLLVGLMAALPIAVTAITTYHAADEHAPTTSPALPAVGKG